jgi:hypothetical protein
MMFSSKAIFLLMIMREESNICNIDNSHVHISLKHLLVWQVWVPTSFTTSIVEALVVQSKTKPKRTLIKFERENIFAPHGAGDSLTW